MYIVNKMSGSSWCEMAYPSSLVAINQWDASNGENHESNGRARCAVH